MVYSNNSVIQIARLSTPWVKKNKTPNSCSYLHQILTYFLNSFTDTQQEICKKKTFITNPTTSQTCHYITLKHCTDWKHSSGRQTWQALRHWTECDRSRWVLPVRNSSFSASNSTIGYSTDHIFRRDLDLKCLIKSPAICNQCLKVKRVAPLPCEY